MPGYKNIHPAQNRTKKSGMILLIILMTVMVGAVAFLVPFGNRDSAVTTRAPETTSPMKINLPGLYDGDGNLLASWDELVNTYGMRVDEDYTSDSNDTKNHRRVIC